MLRRFAISSLLALATLSGVAQAQNYRDCCCYNGGYIGAEWLYLRAYGVDLAFGRTINDIDLVFGGTGIVELEEVILTRDADVHCVQPNFSSGVRVWAGYDDPCSCWGIRASYLYWDTSDRGEAFQDVTGIDIDDIEPVIGFEGRSSFNYQAATLEVTGELTSCDCPFTILGFAGVGYAEVDHKLNSLWALLIDPDVEDFFAVIPSSDRSYFSGVGPRLGLDFTWELPCFSCLALHSTLAADFLVSKTKADRFVTLFIDLEEITDILPDLELNFNERLVNCYRMIPSLEAKIGLQGTWACGCTSITGEIGYRVDYYLNGLDVHRQVAGNLVGIQGAVEILQILNPPPPPPGPTADNALGGPGPLGLLGIAGYNSTRRHDVSFGGLYLGLQVDF